MIDKLTNSLEEISWQRKIYFHCGPGKTGSSALQAFFLANREKLIANDIGYENYPEVSRENEITSGNGHLLHDAISNNFDVEQFDQVIESYFKNTSKTIISSENLGVVSVGDWKRIKQSCKRLNIEIVLISFVRNVEPFYHSAYNQMVKRHGETSSYENFVTSNPDTYNHVSHLKRLSKVFDHKTIKVLHYDTVKNYLDSAFFGAIEQSSENYDRTLVVQKVNRSLLEGELRLLKKVNEITEQRFSQEISDMLIYARPDLSEAKRTSPEIVDLLTVQFKDDLSWVNTTYFGGKTLLIIANEVLQNEAYPVITNEKLVEIEDDILEWSVKKLQALNVHECLHVKQDVTDFIRVIFDQHHDILRDCFDVDFYLRMYPDIAAAGLDPYQHYLDFGMAEGRLISDNPGKLLQNALVLREKELHDKLSLAWKHADDQLIDLAERESYFAHQLVEIKKNYQNQLSEKDQKNADMQYQHLQEFSLIKEQLELHLLELAERENASKSKLIAIQHQNKEVFDQQVHRHELWEKNHLVKLNQAQQQISLHLSQLSEREKQFFETLQKNKLIHEQQTSELNREYLVREQNYLAQLNQVQQQKESQLLKLVDREKEFSLQLTHLQEESIKSISEQSQDQIMREREFSARIQHQQSEFDQKKSEQYNLYSEREQSYVARLDVARQQTEIHLVKLSEREREFSVQLQKIQQESADKLVSQSKDYEEKELVLSKQLEQVYKQIELQVNKNAERESIYLQEIQRIQQEHHKEQSELAHANAEREQFYRLQLDRERAQTNDSQLKSIEREKEFGVKLQLLQADFEQKKTEQNAIYTEREEELRTLLESSRKKNEDGLRALAELELKYTNKLHDLQHGFEVKKYQYEKECAERETNSLELLEKAQKTIEYQLQKMVECEREFADCLKNKHNEYENRSNLQNAEYVEREKNYLNLLENAQDKIEFQLNKLIECEVEFASRLQGKQHEFDNALALQQQERVEIEQSCLEVLERAQLKIESQYEKLLECENEFGLRLQSEQRDFNNALALQQQEEIEIEQSCLEVLERAQLKIEYQYEKLLECENEFGSRLQSTRNSYDEKYQEIVDYHNQREASYLTQIEKAQQETEAQLRKLAEFEADFSIRLVKDQQEYVNASVVLVSQFNAREQVLQKQLEVKNVELINTTSEWTEAEKVYLQTLSDLRSELEEIRGTLTWRWTAPFRTLAGYFSSDSATKNHIHTLPEDSNKVQFDDGKKVGLGIIDSASSNLNNRILNMTTSHIGNKSQTLEELLSFDDEYFVRNAYQTLLGRIPDRDGMTYYLGRIRKGIDKVEILSQLYLSAEGKLKGVSIAGLNEEIQRLKSFKKSLTFAIYKFCGTHSMQQKIRAIENRIFQLDAQFQMRLAAINIQPKVVQPTFETVSNPPMSEPQQVVDAIVITPTELVPELEQVTTQTNPPALIEDIVFDRDWYLQQYPDIAESGMDPYTHYMQYGKYEGRYPSFDRDWYLTQYEDIAKAGLDPLNHYLQHGKLEGRFPAFDGVWYLDSYPDVVASKMDPLDHYLQHGKAEGRQPGYSEFAPDGKNYTKWVQNYDTLTDDMRASMHVQCEKFNTKPLISIVIPVYNPNPDWLIEVIESVRSQIYSNWELCLADDVSTNVEIRPILENYMSKDSRIKVVFRKENGHISKASNSALEVATGDWIALVDHDDIIPDHALFWVVDAINKNPDIRMIYSDEDKINEKGSRSSPHFKTDWNPDLFYSYNMFCHLGVYKADLIREIGGFQVGMEGSQDYDLVMRCIERVTLNQIHHIPRVLYHWRVHAASTASAKGAKPYAAIAGEKALDEHFKRIGVKATSESVELGYRVRYALPEIQPLVTLIIPTRNGLKLLKQCIDSIIEKTTYKNYEILIIDNGSDDPATLSYMSELAASSKARVLRDDGPFNYSALNNGAVKVARGELVGLINNDIEVISPEWLSEMVSHALRPEIGCVGAKLWYSNNTLQHGGVILGLGGVAGHSLKYLPMGNPGYFGRANVIQSLSAVTAACLIIRKSTYLEVNGLNENDLKIAFNDVDFCIRVREAGYRNLYTPFAELYHHESATRGVEDTPEKQARFSKEVNYMKTRWEKQLQHDPAYSPNLTILAEDFSFACPPRVDRLA